jgi:hypothetical protein
MNWIPHIIAISGSDLGVILSLIVIGGGMIWLLLQSIKAGDVDRRIVFLFIFISVSVPILFPITFAESPTPIVKKLYDRIESLPEGSTVLISFDFDPAMAPEVQPMADAFARHCFTKNHKIIFMSLWATGQALLNTTLQNVVRPEFPEKIEGIDYANIGYKAGNEGVLNVIVTNFRKMFPTDVNSVPLDSIAIFKKIRSCQDMDLIISIGGGKPGVKEWILFVGDPGNVPIGCGVAAVVAPQLYPYYPKQLLGILGGIKGAAEYESALVHQYNDRFANVDKPGLRMMGPQTLAHVVIMAFIVLGNISYFVARRRGKKQ